MLAIGRIEILKLNGAFVGVGLTYGVSVGVTEVSEVFATFVGLFITNAPTSTTTSTIISANAIPIFLPIFLGGEV
jgi:hypothetical protein